MKHITLITLGILITMAALLVQCSEHKKEQIYTGYYPVGPYRPRGIAPEKGYNFADLYASNANSGRCNNGGGTGETAGENCAAVYTRWFTGSTLQQSSLTDGVAVSDSHVLDLAAPLQPIFSMTIIRGVLPYWSVTMKLNGATFVNIAVPLSYITISCGPSPSGTRYYPAYDPENTGTPTVEASGSVLQVCTVDFQQNITLTCGSTPFVIRAGDRINAQKY